MSEHIKLGSDRPDIVQTLFHLGGRSVDLRPADAVFIEVWRGTEKLIDDEARIMSGPLGEVAYDIEREQIDEPGMARYEFRVEWGGGDHQWFPIDERGWELEIVPPPGNRTISEEFEHNILRVDVPETYDVDGTETYTRVENAGVIRSGPNDRLQIHVPRTGSLQPPPQNHAILQIAPTDTYVANDTETYTRVENSGEMQIGPDDEVQI